MTTPSVVVVEDEEDIRELVAFTLGRGGFHVSPTRSGEEGLAEVRELHPDLVLLDLMLPGVDGLEVCRIMKADPKLSEIPVVMLTAKGEEADIVAGLEIGADDYVTKPFSPRILLARIRAVLRRRERGAPEQDTVVKVHDLVLDPVRREASVQGQAVRLTAQEFDLLHLLVQKPGWVYTRGQIVTAVRGEDYPVTERAVDVQLVGLRKKLGPAAQYIETVRGVGYRFADRVAE